MVLLHSTFLRGITLSAFLAIILGICHAAAPRPPTAPGDLGGNRNLVASAPDNLPRPDAPRLSVRTAKPRLGTRERVLFEAAALVGTREVGGNNRGEIIENIIANAGFDRASAIPYCGAFNRWVYDRAGFSAIGPQGQRSAWSPAWLAGATWTRANGGSTPKSGDAVGFWNVRLDRIGHTGLVESWSETVAIIIEGNTGPDVAGGVNRDGDGIWRKKRQVRQIHAARDWITP